MANEVGKAYVSIIASIKGIHKDIQRQLKKDLAGVEAEIVGKVDFDTKQVTSAASEATKTAAKAVPPISSDVAFDKSKAVQSARDAISAAQKAAPDVQGVRVILDKDGLVKEVRLAVKTAQATSPKIEVTLGLDRKKFDRLTQSIGNFGSSPLKGAAEAAESLARAISGPLLDGVANLSSTFGKTGTAALGMGTAIVSVSLALGVLVLALGTVILLLGTFIGVALAGAATLVTVLALAVPAAAVPALAAFSALSLGADKLGASFAAIASGDLKAFNESLVGLSPQLAKFVNAFRPLLSLKEKVGNALFSGIFQAFNGTLPTIISQFQTLVLGATNSLNGFFISVIQQWTSVRNQVKIGSIFSLAVPAMQAFLQNLLPLTQGLLDVAAAGAPGFVKLATALGQVGGKFGDFLSKISNSGALDRLLDKVVEFIDVAGDGLIDLFSALVDNAPAFLDAFTSMAGVFGPLSTVLADFLAASAPGLTKFFEALATALSDPATVQSFVDLGMAMSDLFIALIPAIPLLIILVDTLTPFIEILARTSPLFLIYLAAILLILQVIFLTITTAIEGYILAFKKLPEVWEAVKDAVGVLKEFLSNAFEKIKMAFQFVLDKIKSAPDVVGNMVTNVISFFKNLGSRAKEIFLNIVGAIGRFLSEGLSKAVEGARKIKDGIVNKIREIVGKLYEAGKDIIRGLIDGIKDMAKRAADAVKDVVEGALERGKKFLRINSPSKLVAAELGEPFSEGLAFGIAKGAKLPEQAAVDMVQSAINAVKPLSTTASISTRFSNDIEPAVLVQMLVDAQMDRPVILMSENYQIARVVNDENKKLARR